MYSSQNIIQVIKSRGMKWIGYVVCMEDRRGTYRVLVVRPDGKKPLGRYRHKWKITLQSIYKWDAEAWSGLFWLWLGSGGWCSSTW
jgi:hypothetical protein